MTNKKIIKIIATTIAIMLIITAISPLIYDVFCKISGVNGTIAKLKVKSQLTAKQSTKESITVSKTVPTAESKTVPTAESKSRQLTARQSTAISQQESKILSPEDLTAYLINNKTAKDAENAIRIEFDVNMDPKLGWEFKPLSKYVYTQPGRAFLVYFYAKNITSQNKIGTAIYNVTPVQTGQYFVKIQCFCFENIFLKAGQEMKMPVLFVIDEDVLKNNATKNIKLITLSYTFFLSPANNNKY